MTTTLRRTVQVVATLATLTSANTAPAHGQLGGLKKKVKQAVGQTAVQQATGGTGAGATSPTAAATPSSSGGPVKLAGNVLPMDDDVLDRLTKAIAAEAADRVQAGVTLSKLPNNQAWQQCEQSVAQGPAGLRVSDSYMKAIQAAGDDMNAVQKATMDADSMLKAAYTKQCGASSQQDLDDQRRALQKRPLLVGAQTGGFTDSQYAVLKERVPPFCNAGSKLQQAAGGGKVHSMGGVYYVYTDDEMQALQPRCPVLINALATLG